MTVAGRTIGGMVYIGPEPGRNWVQSGGGAFIDPELPVATVASDFSGQNLPYWPCYSDINPQARATYLDWLAGGRSDKRYGPGYVFLYFYGLERRFFVDSPAEDEKRLLVKETERLLSIYGENHSVRRYLETFLDAAHIALGSIREVEPRFKMSGYELSLALRVVIGLMAKEGQPLSADWLLSWYATHPETRLRQPAIRAFPEFKALFSLIFNERFPKGLRMRSPKRTLCARYTAASLKFHVDLNLFLDDIPDISRISKPLTIAKDLAEEAAGALAKYSRFLGRNPEGRDTIEAHALLPESLWSLFPCAEMENMRHWADGVIETGGLAPVEQVIERLEGSLPEKIGKRHLTAAADALARLSIGMAPDPRFAMWSPQLGESLVLFRLPEGITALEDVSEKYKNILVAIAMGSFVAHADGKIAAKEYRTLEAMIDTEKLSAVECARLFANLQWMFAIPPDLTRLRRRLKDIPESIRHDLGQIALTIAAIDGVIDQREVTAIEKIYKAIGLATDDVYSDLHALSAQSELVTVRPANEQERGFSIPPPARANKVTLDAGRIASVMADTARVSSVLEDIFHDDESKEEVKEIRESAENGFAGLNKYHGAFLQELLTRPHWDEVEFKTLADQFQLMPAGALETLNEWAVDCFGDTLIEEYEGYELNQDVKAALQTQRTTDAASQN